MEEFIMKRDYLIFIYREEDREKYNAVLKALAKSKHQGGWNRVQGVQIGNDCRIPSIYHGNDYAVIMERDEGHGWYTVEIMQ